MTEEQLQAIRERLDSVKEYGKEWTSFDDIHCEESDMVSEYDALTESGVRWLANCQSKELAHFIAHAREDVPALLAEVERLQKLVESGHRTVDFVRKRYHTMEEEMFRLIAENERLLGEDDD